MKKIIFSLLFSLVAFACFSQAPDPTAGTNIIKAPCPNGTLSCNDFDTCIFIDTNVFDAGSLGTGHITCLIFSDTTKCDTSYTQVIEYNDIDTVYSLTAGEGILIDTIITGANSDSVSWEISVDKDYLIDCFGCALLLDSASVCEYVIANPDSPIATEDCDDGTVDNLTECQMGMNPLVPDDDVPDLCEVADCTYNRLSLSDSNITHSANVNTSSNRCGQPRIRMGTDLASSWVEIAAPAGEVISEIEIWAYAVNGLGNDRYDITVDGVPYLINNSSIVFSANCDGNNNLTILDGSITGANGANVVDAGIATFQTSCAKKVKIDNFVGSPGFAGTAATIFYCTSPE